jgi:uncharacterized protein
MSEHPYIARLRDAYAAFGKGDLDALQEIWSPELRWHAPGNNPLAGTYEGVPAVLAFLGQVLELTQGTFRAEPQTLCAGGDLGVAVVRLTGRREGRSLDVIDAQVSRFDGDRIVEFRDTSSDLEAVDRFFG